MIINKTEEIVEIEEKPADQAPVKQQQQKRKVEDRELWKLVKGKFMLATYLCPGKFLKIKF